MEFLAFPAAGVGIFLLWAAGVPLLGALFFGPAISLGILAVALQLVWPNTPGKKKKVRTSTGVRIAEAERPRRGKSEPDAGPPNA